MDSPKLVAWECNIYAGVKLGKSLLLKFLVTILNAILCSADGGKLGIGINTQKKVFMKNNTMDSVRTSYYGSEAIDQIKSVKFSKNR